MTPDQRADQIADRMAAAAQAVLDAGGSQTQAKDAARREALRHTTSDLQAAAGRLQHLLAE